MTRIGPSDLDEVDRVALEEPLQLVVDGHPVAVLMRTPGNDEELAAGFLWTEGIVSSQEEIARIDLEAKENHALVFLADGVGYVGTLVLLVYKTTAVGISYSAMFVTGAYIFAVTIVLSSRLSALYFGRYRPRAADDEGVVHSYELVAGGAGAGAGVQATGADQDHQGQGQGHQGQDQ